MHTKVSYKAQLYAIMYNLWHIKAINSDNVGIKLHNFARYSDKVYCASFVPYIETNTFLVLKLSVQDSWTDNTDRV